MTTSSDDRQINVKALRILVVEDEVIIASDIAYSLQDMGHHVIGPATTVDEALTFVRSEAIDCAFLDANLKGTSSAPIAAELAARGVKFVVITGYAKMKLDTLALNSAPRISKPFSVGDFSAAINALFPFS